MPYATRSSDHLRRAACTRSAAAGLYKGERVITSPQRAHVGVAGRDDAAEPVRQQLSGPGRPSRRSARRRAGAGPLGLRHGQRPLHLRHAGNCTRSSSGRWPSSSAPRTRSSIRPASTPTAGCSRRSSAAEDAVISDELNHASIIDGVRLCKAQRFRYRNNDMADLEAKLQEARAGAVPADRHRRRFLDGRHHRQPAGDLRPGRPLRRAGDGGRLARRRLHRAGRPRHARVSRRDGPHRHPHRHARQGPGRRQRRLHLRRGGRSSNSCASARGPTCSPTRCRRRSWRASLKSLELLMRSTRAARQAGDEHGAGSARQ